MVKATLRSARKRRHARVRARVTGTTIRPRLCVFRSANHIYAQIIDDSKQHSLAAASTLDPELASELAGKSKTARSELVGSLIAKRALAEGIKETAFDRGGYKYHGRVKALAEAARAAGLKF